MSMLFSGLSAAFSAALYFILALNLFGLPANWLILGAIALWEYFWPLAPDLSVLQWAFLTGLALAGELAETVLQVFRAKKYGSSSRGAYAAVIGAIAGAIVLSPLFWGLGALAGALLGSFTGCYIIERLSDRPHAQALKSAWGALTGNLIGAAAKIGMGALIIITAAHWLWAEPEFKLPAPPAPVLEAVYA